MIKAGRSIALFFCFIIAAAQQQPGPELDQQDTAASFKAKVNVVLVPVVVRDRDGRPVGNLGKEDFQLFDKGKPQAISSFTVEKSGGRAAPRQDRPDANPAGEKTPAAPERFTAYLFDDMHLSFSDLVRSRDAAARHFDATLESVDRAAIVSTSGQTVLDFTDDRAKLHETLLRLRPRSMARSGVQECPDISYYQADLIQNKQDSQALAAATSEVMACQQLDETMRGFAQKIAQAAAVRVLAAGEMESRVALSVLKDTVRRMSVMPGRRSIVLVSPGFLTLDRQQQDKTDIMDRAIHSNVVISALDARGLYTLIPGGDASTQMFDARAQILKDEYARTSALIEADVMAELADGTGGTFFQNSNDLEGGFKRLAAAPEYVYVIGFSPQNLKLDGSFHKLKVTLKDPARLSLKARRGYYAPTHLEDAAEQARREVEEALFSREEVQELPIELHTQFFKATDATAKLAILVRIDLKQVRFRKVDGRNHNQLTIVSGLFDRNGNYVTAIQKLLTMRLEDETLQARLASGITVKTSFDVKPGAYAIRLVVRDAEGQLMSAQNGAVEIP